jgi:hypothetical protein
VPSARVIAATGASVRGVVTRTGCSLAGAPKL